MEIDKKALDLIRSTTPEQVAKDIVSVSPDRSTYESKPAGAGKDVGCCPRCTQLQYIKRAEKTLWKCRDCGMLIENDKPYILGENVSIDYPFGVARH